MARLRTWLIFLSLATALGLGSLALAATTPDGGAPTDAGVLDADDPRATQLREKARRVRELQGGTLATDVDPLTLFDVALDDEEAVLIEANRLAVVVSAAGTDAGHKGTQRDAEAARGPLWDARIDLDAARLAFLVQDATTRRAQLAAHAERQRAAQPPETEEQRRARETEEERARAQEAALRARTEAERLVAEEQLRLLEVAKGQEALEAGLEEDRAALRQRTERTLSLKRRVRELPDGDEVAADALYEELRTFLRTSRAELASALSAKPTRAQGAGPDPLVDLPLDVDRGSVDLLRGRIAKNGERVSGDVERQHRARIRQLYDEVQALNADRLALLPHLSARRRDALKGFGSVGLDQAGAEIEQLTLVLRTHVAAIGRWATEARAGRVERDTAFALGSIVAEWLVGLAVLLAWRRRAVPLLDAWRARTLEQARRTVRASWLERALDLSLRVRKATEGLVLLAVLVWLLPDAARAMLEVQLLVSVLAWTLGGSLVVVAVDALFGEDRRGTAKTRMQTAHVRLRSLRLVGRTFVALGLLSSVATKLVGAGTLRAWVVDAGLLAAAPVVFVLVRWWRPIVFERLRLARRKGPLARWILGHERGVASFLAALIGGVWLLGAGTLRRGRGWVSGFLVARRVLAWLFRRELDKKADEDATRPPLAPLPEASFRALGPETASTDVVEGITTEDVARVLGRVAETGGGVYAVVGERGAGKSTVLRRVAAQSEEIVRVQCPERLDELAARLAEALELPVGTPLEDSAKAMERRTPEPALLLDDAHHLMQPRMGGLVELDRLLAVARAHSARCAWFLAIDEVLWAFLARARGERPLFDDVIQLTGWREEDIARLLVNRSAQAGIEPSFERVMERLPEDADETERHDAEEHAASGYRQLVWDYARGNPGVALHTWRRALGVDAEGKVHVRGFTAPDTAELEALSDQALFVVRAVMQLSPAAPGDVVRATQLSATIVTDALRYGTARGWMAHRENRFEISWDWFRASTLVLRRRHLLARESS